MKEDEFGAAADRALAFSGTLIANLNVSSALMHLLIAKGLLTREEALWVLDQAAGATAQIDVMPEVYAKGIAGTLARVRQTFE